MGESVYKRIERLDRILKAEGDSPNKYKVSKQADVLMLFYLTPVIYPLSLVKDSFKPLLFSVYMCNPFVNLINAYRIVLLKGFYEAIKQDISFLNIVVGPVAFTAIILLLGIYFYRKNMDSINDYISY